MKRLASCRDVPVNRNRGTGRYRAAPPFTMNRTSGADNSTLLDSLKHENFFKDTKWIISIQRLINDDHDILPKNRYCLLKRSEKLLWSKNQENLYAMPSCRFKSPKFYCSKIKRAMASNWPKNKTLPPLQTYFGKPREQGFLGGVRVVPPLANDEVGGTIPTRAKKSLVRNPWIGRNINPTDVYEAIEPENQGSYYTSPASKGYFVFCYTSSDAVQQMAD
uniref:Uncharacterized protein n=1 Tax=Romanomermis culicivorax TaxID=13658 RepID=A0A915JRM3_ROMCU